MPAKILVDTSVWIEFFRRKNSPASSKLREYLELNEVCLAGPVCVELYQGARTTKEIEIIDELLEAIHYIEITRKHWHHAGEISYAAARKGQIFSVVDLILAAVAHDEQLRLFSLDAHFRGISEFCTLTLEMP
jgi:predicted nucleic acid-binding protein